MADLRVSGLGGIPFGNTSNRPSNPVVGTVYYNGQLEIIEIYNGTSWVANSAPPAVPSIVSVTDVGTGLAYATGGTFTVVVSPGSGGSTPLQYNAATSAGGFSASSNSTTLSLTGLTSNTSFVVAANAQNNFGTTVNSSPFSATLATTVPQAPTIGTATASTTAEEITVTWTLGSNGGKNLSAITITPYLNGTTAETSRTAATTSSTSYTFTAGELTATASYTFKVRTTNANGNSAYSTATNSATMPSYLTVDALLVAGGGAGGNWHAGGGGAGGYRAFDSLVLNKAQTYTITVGAGGAGGTVDVGSNGGDTIAFSYTASGGGRGGKYTTVPPASGGSGGGGNGWSGAGSTVGAGNTPSTSPSQGNNGGIGNFDHSGGGGGGAGAVGGNCSPNVGGNGGVGINWKSLGTFYAGGGGGGNWGGSSIASGGSGGGGNGSYSGNTGAPTPGAANSGGGGGGSGSQGNNTSYAAQTTGGSGIVIMRTNSTYTASATTGSPTRTVTGGYTYYTFTGDGSITI